MNKAVPIILLIVGIALVILGIAAMAQSFSGFHESLTGSPIDTSIWMLTLGLVSISVSWYGLIHGSKEAA